MFRLHRSARARRDKVREANAWAKEVADYLSAKYAPITVQAYAERFGDVGTVHFFSDYKDLATLERFWGLWRIDQEYRSMLEKAPELFIEEREGSFHDTLMQML